MTRARMVLGVLAALLPPAIVLAEPDVPERRATPRIAVAVRSSPGAEIADETALRTPLMRLHTDVVFDRSPAVLSDNPLPDTSSFARVYVDLRSTSRVAVLVVFDGASGRVVARREIARNGSDEVVREEVALILESTIESALLDARAIRASASASASAPPGVESSRASAADPSVPAAPRPPGVYGEVAGYFALSSLAPKAKGAPGGGLAVALGARRWPLSPALMLAGWRLSTTSLTSMDVSLSSGVSSLRLWPTIEPLSAHRVSLRVGLGPGLDAVSTDARSRHAVPRPSSSSVSWTASGLVQGNLWITPALGFFAAGTLDFDLSPHRFVVAGPDGQRPILAPDRWRRTLLVGLSFTLAGPSHE